jgi:hypothetical protein
MSSRPDDFPRGSTQRYGSWRWHNNDVQKLENSNFSLWHDQRPEDFSFSVRRRNHLETWISDKNVDVAEVSENPDIPLPDSEQDETPLISGGQPFDRQDILEI